MTCLPIESPGQVFDLTSLFFDLSRYCQYRFKRLGCMDPEECADAVVFDYVLKRRLRRDGRCRIFDDKIVISIPKAVSQEAVLRTLLKFEIRHHRNACETCKLKNASRISEPGEGDDNERTQNAIVVDPVTPEDIFQNHEALKKGLSGLPASHVEAFEARANGDSYREISKRTHVEESTIRQWISRDRKKLKEVFGRLVQREENEPAGAQPQPQLTEHDRHVSALHAVGPKRRRSDASTFTQLIRTPTKGDSR